jgi:hypothetical protein
VCKGLIQPSEREHLEAPPSWPLASYGCGQALEQLAIASPTFLGHVV